MGAMTTHPQWLKFSLLWEKMMDCFQGADHIKSLGTKYLPATASMEYDGMDPGQDGRKRYDAYKQRAKFPEYVNDAVLQHGGTLHRKPAVIVMPEGMEPLRKRITSKGEGLDQLLRRINELQLRDGRLGLLVDLPEGETRGTMPYVAVYEALAIRNWDDGDDTLGHKAFNFVRLDESKYVMDHSSKEWHWKIIYRDLLLGTGATDEQENTGAKYHQVLQEVSGSDDAAQESVIAEVTPMYNGKAMEAIPFVFCNAMDLVAEPDRPPLLTLANNALSIYQGEADYRQSLFMQGQDTLVVKGGVQNTNQVDDKAPVRVGAGARIDVPPDGDAKYVGVNSQGLPEQRKALEADHKDAQARSGSLTSSESASQESGDALRIRTTTKTASLVGIAITGAAALEQVLRYIAEWMGFDPNEVTVSPNIDFSKTMMIGQDFVQVMTAKNLGAPISAESVHNWLADNSMTTLSFEDEMKRIQEENQKYKDLLQPIQKPDQNQLQQTGNGDTGKTSTTPPKQ